MSEAVGNDAVAPTPPDNSPPPVIASLQQAFAKDLVEWRQAKDMLEIQVRTSALDAVARHLRDTPGLDFNFLIDQTAVDWLGQREVRFELVYHFWSLAHHRYLRLLAPVAEERCEAPSLYGLWKAADWYEREIHEMYGIRFSGHPDMRKLLMYPEFKGWPLRKDYSMKGRQPLIGPGSRQE
ncbi:MAG: NADH-quinone oxidoreductase subunit C [Calditrichaeota bacterium]|nr:NADH-quinone oxidoreductase subunit C [Candidatus Cloacimonadota bacterium]MCA9785403.1 NADH-quinone oxidoreductase subunit C [Candidatus Cloacimonadota bacterium]MCB1046012.1 NADH-quinone oxidoreductase subunit C [Calditrichota bacterium]MCB9473114.1 NADH-quinone oxidoreductase subunit C [Candidatus Delongbacteria bacterium]